MSDQVDCRAKSRIVTGSVEQSMNVYRGSPNACAAGSSNTREAKVLGSKNVSSYVQSLSWALAPGVPVGVAISLRSWNTAITTVAVGTD